MSLDDIQVGECLDYIERHLARPERRVEVLQNKEAPLVQVQWEHHRGSEWTWEPVAGMGEH